MENADEKALDNILDLFTQQPTYMSGIKDLKIFIGTSKLKFRLKEETNRKTSDQTYQVTEGSLEMRSSIPKILRALRIPLRKKQDYHELLRKKIQEGTKFPISLNTNFVNSKLEVTVTLNKLVSEDEGKLLIRQIRRVIQNWKLLLKKELNINPAWTGLNKKTHEK